MTANPDDLDRLAQYVNAKADELRHVMNEYSQRTSRVEWVGDAAQGFREDVGGRRGEVEQACQRLGQVADSLRRGAEQIRREERERREREARARGRH